MSSVAPDAPQPQVVAASGAMTPAQPGPSAGPPDAAPPEQFVSAQPPQPFQSPNDGLNPPTSHIFLQQDDQQQPAVSQPQDQVQRQRTKPVYTQEPDPAAAHLSAQAQRAADQYARRPQFTQSNDPAAQQGLVQIQSRGFVGEQRVAPNHQVSAHGDVSAPPPQGPPAGVPGINNPAGATAPGGPVGNPAPGADAFTSSPMVTTAGGQFAFDARRQVNAAGQPQHPSVVLGFTGEYIPQQEQGAPLGPEARDFQQRFEGDTGISVVYEIPKDIDPAKRMVAAVPHDAVVTTAGMTAPMQVQGVGVPVKTEAAARVAAAALPYGGETVDKCVECEVCGSLFGDAGSLKRHAARAHRAATGKGPVYCSQCSASLKNEQNLRRHIAVCHSGSQENRCDMCSASFSSRGSLRIHQQTVHSVPSASKSAATRNGRGVTNGEVGGRPRGGISKPKAEKSYLCDMCTDTFKWKGNLKRHRELRHLQLRPFECHVCHANFGTKSNMRVHLITHQNTQAPK